MVINMGALKDEDYRTVKKDINVVKEAVVGVNPRAEVKVIIETFDLTKEEKRKASELVKEAGADFVKTSTGYKEGGATVEDVKLIRETVGEDFGVKAAGGIRNLEEAREMIEAGADRIGTSTGVKIMEGEKVEEGRY
jgi:deoxyribose-phosphate aldolase